MTSALRVFLSVCIFGIVVVFPIVHYRAVYSHGKRLRPIEVGRVYRSGQLTAAGFEDAVARHGIRTIVNLQNDNLDPDVQLQFRSSGTIKESELCASMGVRYIALSPDLIPRRQAGEARPTVIEDFLAVMDDPANYPVLFHCKAGLHRTGLLAAIYRMEYQGWTMGEAYRELKAHGFGDWACTAANDYVQQYLLMYQPGVRQPSGVAQGVAGQRRAP